MNIEKYIEHTILKQTTTLADVERICNEAKTYKFAAVCIPPLYVKKTKEFLAGSGVNTCTVIGFPFGYCAIEAKVAELVLATVDGADELDMVVNVSAIKNGDWTFLANEINTVMPIVKSKGKIIKLIIESGVLTDDEIIKCCDIYGAAGVDYMKTSTGFAEKGASIHAVQLMRNHLADAIKIKAAGGIRSFSFAKELINAGADRIGCSSSLKIVEESKEFFEK
ncbi:MAG TPA: deoxyribose-phosphate aldolase [Ginsengibacter sp.]|nr:deoxyribose-phosphate aldolase [Chitinophagales bacterium]HRN73578.1 deoxyribose-phosphate aldolase [Ginsengibacter sp.]HRP16905.1 deoxyribose-phosphate aldolase [Ginsengibacter sp.]HRP44867.1 deoxyribose-phosphate aldolase [Ginsengibacter sp.]